MWQIRIDDYQSQYIDRVKQKCFQQRLNTSVEHDAVLILYIPAVDSKLSGKSTVGACMEQCSHRSRPLRPWACPQCMSAEAGNVSKVQSRQEEGWDELWKRCDRGADGQNADDVGDRSTSVLFISWRIESSASIISLYTPSSRLANEWHRWFYTMVEPR